MSTRSQGFVLVNALVLIAALAGATAFMLARAEGARVRGAAAVQTTQLGLYLDGAEALALTLIEADSGQGPDHPGEAWARAQQDLPLDRGMIDYRFSDLQGRFNLNWLANPEERVALAAFERLLTGLAIPNDRIAAITAFLAPDGPTGPGARAYAAANPASRPRGGAIAMAEQLQTIPAVTDKDWRKLAPLVAALPADSKLNINTAPPEVLGAFLPGIGPTRIAALVAQRQQDPFPSVEAFMLDLGALLPEDLEEDRLSVFSDWFRLSAEARLDGRRARRISVIERQAFPLPARVAYRLDEWP